MVDDLFDKDKKGDPKQSKTSTKPETEKREEAEKKPDKTQQKPVKKELVKVEDSGLPSEIRLANGDIIPLRHRTFRLKEGRKQLYHVKNDFRITAEGYFYVNKFANINILTPPTVVVDGVDQGNPYIVRDKKTLQIQMVIIRKIAFGRAPTGNLVAIDQTLSYSPKSYYIRKLIDLCDTSPSMSEMRTEQSLSTDERKNCHFEEITPGLGVLIKKVGHLDFLKVLKTFADNQIFGERKATTICERNCFRKHPAIGVSNVQLIGSGQNAYAQVTSYAFGETERSRDKISHLSQMIEKGKIEELRDIEVMQSVDTLDKIEEAEVIPTENDGKDD